MPRSKATEAVECLLAGNERFRKVDLLQSLQLILKFPMATFQPEIALLAQLMAAPL